MSPPGDRSQPFGRGKAAARVLARVIEASVSAGSRAPAPLVHRLAIVGGHLEWMARPGKRRRLAANLSHAIGVKPAERAVRRLVRHEIVNEAHRSADLLWALGRPDDFYEQLEVDGLEHARRLVEAGTGFILGGVHLGGWELATAAPQRLIGVRSAAIVAEDWLAWAIERTRVAAGMNVVYRNAPVSHFGAVLRDKQALVVLGDDASGVEPRTHTVRFLDATAELPAGITVLSRLYQAPIVGFAMIRTGRRRWRLVIDPPIPPPPRRATPDEEQAAMQRVADRWSELIRAHPDQWAASFPIRWRAPEPAS